MLNAIWIAMIFSALVFGAATGNLAAVTRGSVQWAGDAVSIAISLIGMMAFWLGMMRVLQDAGLLRLIARGLRPIMTRLFPEVPADHPAMSMMILNITANMLGLGNAATPFGIKAMLELNKLNKQKGTATNAMALFLAINTSNLALLPSGIIGLRTGLGSEAPGSIILTTILATSCSTIVAIVVALSLQRLRAFRIDRSVSVETVTPDADTSGLETADAEALIERQVPSLQSFPARLGLIAMVSVGLMAFGTAIYSDAISVGWLKSVQGFVEHQLLLVLMVTIIAYGIYKKTDVYNSVVVGGKEGFQVALRIIPYLVAILVAVGMLREAGAIDMMAETIGPYTSMIGVPPEVLPMAFLRPLTGQGAYGIAAGIMQVYGTDTLVGQIVSTMQGSTETTFYVLALYFGVVGVKKVRHTIIACLSADVVGALAAVWACRLLLT